MKKRHKIMIPILTAIASIVIAVSLIFTVSVVGVIALPWTLMGIYYNFLAEDLPAPSVTYCEFPFEIVYEIDDETVVVNDVFVCEFVGYGVNEGVGKHRKWKGYVKSTGEDGVLIAEDDVRKVYVGVGDPEYYMGEYKNYTPAPNVYDIDKIKNDDLFLHGELEEKYNIKIIRWTFSEPIENTFEKNE